MAQPLDRTWFNSLVDDDGTGTTGTVWNKTQVDGLLDTVDAALAPLLGDYHEGVWVPGLSGSGGSSGTTYAYRGGSYVKIGRLVIAEFGLGLATKGTITGTLVIQGFPYPAAGASGSCLVSFIGMATTWTSIRAQMSSVPTQADLFGMGPAGSTNNWGSLTGADVTNGTDLRAVMIYFS